MSNDPPSRVRRAVATGWWVLVGLIVLAVVGADVVLLPGSAVGPPAAGAPVVDDPVRVLVWTVVSSSQR